MSLHLRYPGLKGQSSEVPENWDHIGTTAAQVSTKSGDTTA
jgi:hypothetical protein